MHLVGFTIGIYYDARTYERQMNFELYTTISKFRQIERLLLVSKFILLKSAGTAG